MSKNHRRYIEAHLARVAAEREHGATLDEVEALIAEYSSPDAEVRAAALRRSCPCHVSWEVYERLRKPALRLRKDRDLGVRALANHLEEDARQLEAMEADIRRYEDRDDDLSQRFRPSRKGSKRPGQRTTW